MLDTSTDINAELLYYTGSTWAPVVTLLLSRTPGSSLGIDPWGAIESADYDITANSTGQLYDQTDKQYQSPTIPPATVVTFEVEGWLGGDSYATATGPEGTTATFTDTLSYFINPNEANIGNMPELNLVPEPAVFALMGLTGLLSLVWHVRRN